MKKFIFRLIWLAPLTLNFAGYSQGRCCIYEVDAGGRNNLAPRGEIKNISNQSDCDELLAVFRRQSPGKTLRNKFYGAGQSAFCPNPLESLRKVRNIQLSSFTGKNDDKDNVALFWKISAGIPYKDLYIERSRDSKSFKKIGYLERVFDDTYRFVDINPLRIGYYRITYTTQEDVIFYSQNICVISVEPKHLTLTPNPSNNTINILIKNMQLNDTRVSIMDLTGKTVLQKTLTGGRHEINVSTLNKGTYIIRVQHNNDFYTEKLLKK